MLAQFKLKADSLRNAEKKPIKKEKLVLEKDSLPLLNPGKQRNQKDS